jgi:hypothetical protein
MTREEMDALLADTGGRYAQLEPPDRAAVPALARSA